MQRSKKDNIKLGMFVLVGTIIFVFVIYFVGARQNLFTSTTQVYAVFRNVDGLREGNSVRFAGIDVGVVRSIDIVSDSTVMVSVIVGGGAQRFIKKDSKVTIGSEGLIGNKLVSISSGTPEAAAIHNGDILPVAEPVTIDEAISMLLQTGENARNISRDLEGVTQMIRNGEGLLGSLVADQTLSDKVERIINQLQASTQDFNHITGDFADMASSLKQGEGTLGQLVNDDQLIIKVNELLDSLQLASHHAVQSTRALSEFTEKLNKEEGLLGQLASDTALSGEVSTLLNNFNQAAKEINTTAEKINRSWLLNLFGGRTNEARNSDEN